MREEQFGSNKVVNTSPVFLRGPGRCVQDTDSIFPKNTSLYTRHVFSTAFPIAIHQVYESMLNTEYKPGIGGPQRYRQTRWVTVATSSGTDRIAAMNKWRSSITERLRSVVPSWPTSVNSKTTIWGTSIRPDPVSGGERAS